MPDKSPEKIITNELIEEQGEELIEENQKTEELYRKVSAIVGWSLESKVFPYLTVFAKKEFGVDVEIIDKRNIVYPNGKYDEVNIYAEGKKNGEVVYIIGECKSNPTIKEVDNFSKLLERLKGHLKGKIYSFIVGYRYTPEVEEYLKEHHPEIKKMRSFEFELNYS